jgi:hypothetical protein
VTGAVDVWRAVHEADSSARAHGTRAALKFAAAGAIAVAAWLAVTLAEHRNGWIDANHDGVLDGFANGPYDWLDVNGDTWARVVGGSVVAVVAALVALLSIVNRRSSRT